MCPPPTRPFVRSLTPRELKILRLRFGVAFEPEGSDPAVVLSRLPVRRDDPGNGLTLRRLPIPDDDSGNAPPAAASPLPPRIRKP